MLTLIIGGARSGKTRFAQSLCAAAARVAYVATALADDEEMRARIERHRQDRPSHWNTLEEPLELGSAVARMMSCSDVILVDCLTVWLANLLWHHRGKTPSELEAFADIEIKALIRLAASGKLILVSNEVGAGIVPDNAVSRSFRDLHGFVNQRAAAAADRVFLTVAGIPVCIKPAAENPTC